MPAPSRPYLSNGQVMQSPPLTARVRNFIDDTYDFLGLYVTSLFSFDAYAAAQSSQFNVNNRDPGIRRRGGYGGGRGGGSGGGGGPGSGSGGSKKLGRVDDIRGQECKSCQ